MNVNAESISRRLAGRLSNAGEPRHLDSTTVSRRIYEAIPKRQLKVSTVTTGKHLERLHATLTVRKGAARKGAATTDR
jgi:hypothetical protein